MTYPAFSAGAAVRRRIDRDAFTIRLGRVLSRLSSYANARPTLTGFARAAKRRVLIWNTRVNERMFLRDLEDCELHEMGLTFDARRREVNKPFWQA